MNKHIIVSYTTEGVVLTYPLCWNALSYIEQVLCLKEARHQLNHKLNELLDE